jgi:hypothetical protein
LGNTAEEPWSIVLPRSDTLPEYVCTPVVLTCPPVRYQFLS